MFRVTPEDGLGLFLLLSLLALSFKWPGIAIVAVAAFVPLQNELIDFWNFGSGVNLSNIFLILLLVLAFTRAAIMSTKPFLKTKFNLPIVVFMLITGIALFRGEILLGLSLLGDNFEMYKNWMLSIILFFFTVRFIESFAMMKAVIFMMAATTLYAAIVSLQQHYALDATVYSHDIRISGIFIKGMINEQAAFLVVYTVVFIGIALNSTNAFLKLLTFALAGVNLFATLFYYSRGAYLAIFFGILAMLTMKLKNKRNVIIIGVVLMMLVNFLPGSVQDRMSGGVGDESAQSRLDFWKDALIITAKKPWGLGFMVFKEQGHFRDTHNMYLNIAVEEGVLGIFLFLWILMNGYKYGMKLYNLKGNNFSRGLAVGWIGCLTGFMLSNMFGNRLTYFPLAGYFWILLGMVVKSVLILKKEQEDDLRNLKS